jgi:tripartite-type tricarboxylate transporter receptor subunit TctC
LFVGILAGCAVAMSHAQAASQTLFLGKTITMIVGTTPGGGNDLLARVIAVHLRKHLPGEPTIVVQNMPGADQIIAANYLERRAPADGLTIMLGSSSPVDPMAFRSANVQYDPKMFRLIGGSGRCGSVIFVNSDAEARLYDKTAAPVVIGGAGSIPVSPLLPALWGIEYLDWNAKWVIGYAGAQEVMLALDRGEVDMTATGNIREIRERLNTGQLKIVGQSGRLDKGKLVGCAANGDVPVFSELMKGKIKGSTEQQAFDYWVARNNLDKWVALPSKTPDDILEIYRTAYDKLAADKEFIEAGGKVNNGFEPLVYSDVQSAIHVLADTPPEALEYIKGLMRKQGIRIQ